MLTRIRHILEMIRFSHTLFALPFALLAALMAWRANPETDFAYLNQTSFNPSIIHFGPGDFFRFDPDHHLDYYRFAGHWRELVGILMCMVTGRSAAMAFNRLADRKIDALNPRTADRHLPSNILSVQSVAIFAILASAAFIVSTLIFLPNRVPLYLSIPMLALMLGYSYAKRFTVLAHFWLGAVLGLAPVMSWVAIRGQFLLVNPTDLLRVVFLSAAVMFWVAGFDIIYACQDADFDRTHKLHAIPARFGVRTAMDVAAACHLVTVLLLALVPILYPWMIGWIWWAGVSAIAALLVYEHSLVKVDDPTLMNKAFFNVNVMVSIGLLIVGTIAISI